MEQTLQKYAEKVSAVIVEPLVQCAGNMRMYDPVYLKLLRAACDKYQVHLIVDEVAVGFGPTVGIHIVKVCSNHFPFDSNVSFI